MHSSVFSDVKDVMKVDFWGNPIVFYMDSAKLEKTALLGQGTWVFIGSISADDLKYVSTTWCIDKG